MLKSKKITLHDKPVKIFQASWDVVMLRTELEEKYTSAPSNETGKETNPDIPADHILAFFAFNFYPALAACTEPMLTLEEAYGALDQIDEWYLAVKALNPSWFEDIELTEESITFSNKTRIIIKSKRPSIIMKMEELDYQASQGTPLENTRREVFRAIYYPKLAGCSEGDVPDHEYARSKMTADDIQLWYDAAKRQNPDWFIPLEQIASRNQAMQKEFEKKSEVTA